MSVRLLEVDSAPRTALATAAFRHLLASCQPLNNCSAARDLAAESAALSGRLTIRGDTTLLRYVQARCVKVHEPSLQKKVVVIVQIASICCFFCFITAFYYLVPHCLSVRRSHTLYLHVCRQALGLVSCKCSTPGTMRCRSGDVAVADLGGPEGTFPLALNIYLTYSVLEGPHRNWR